MYVPCSATGKRNTCRRLVHSPQGRTVSEVGVIRPESLPSASWKNVPDIRVEAASRQFVMELISACRVYYGGASRLRPAPN